MTINRNELNIIDINNILNNYKLYSKEDLKFIRYYIIEHESELRFNYPIVPYDICSDKIMVISDTHLCHKNDNMQYIYWAYETAAYENINNILFAGDIFEGIIPKILGQVKIDTIKNNYNSNYYNYLYSLARTLPNINNIETKILLGNHDLSMLYYPTVTHKDVMNIYDNIPNSELLGIGKVYINWTNINNNTNCKFILNHYTNLQFINHNYDKENIIISGHHHKYEDKDNEVYIPSLSNNRSYYPGIVIMKLEDNKLIIEPRQINPNNNEQIDNKIKTLQL